MTEPNAFSQALYAAFFMEGMQETQFHDVLKAYEPHGGALELVVEVVAYAVVLDRIVANHVAGLVAQYGHADFPGVLEYEVASEFGCYFATYVLDNCKAPSTEQASRWLQAEVYKFFARGTQYIMEEEQQS